MGAAPFGLCVGLFGGSASGWERGLCWRFRRQRRRNGVDTAERLWYLAAGWFRASAHVCRAPRPIAQAVPHPGVDTPGYRYVTPTALILTVLALTEDIPVNGD